MIKKIQREHSTIEKVSKFSVGKERAEFVITKLLNEKNDWWVLDKNIAYYIWVDKYCLQYESFINYMESMERSQVAVPPSLFYTNIDFMRQRLLYWQTELHELEKTFNSSKNSVFCYDDKTKERLLDKFNEDTERVHAFILAKEREATLGYLGKVRSNLINGKISMSSSEEYLNSLNASKSRKNKHLKV